MPNFNLFFLIYKFKLLLLLFYTTWPKISKIGQTIPEILEKMRFSAHKCRHYERIRIFRKKTLGPFYDPLFPLTLCKKSEKTNEPILRKVQKTLFSGHFERARARPGGTRIFSENPASSLSSTYQVTPLCKKTEKTNERLLRKSGTDGRTDGRDWFYRTLSAKAGGPKI